MDLVDALHISAAGMRAQGVRLRVIAENLANANSLAATPDGEPYRRKVVSFRNALDRSDFEMRYQPSHPAADANGYIRLPNVNTLIEMTDMREAQRSYEANLKVIESSRTLLQRTIDILR